MSEPWQKSPLKTSEELKPPLCQWMGWITAVNNSKTIAGKIAWSPCIQEELNHTQDTCAKLEFGSAALTAPLSAHQPLLHPASTGSKGVVALSPGIISPTCSTALRKCRKMWPKFSVIHGSSLEKRVAREWWLASVVAEGQKQLQLSRGWTMEIKFPSE